MNVPLIAGKELIGALDLGDQDTRTFTKEDQEIAQEVADQIAISVEQAPMRKEVERHASVMEDGVRERTAQL